MRRYVQVSGLFFGLVAVGHLVRVVRRWPLLIAGFPVPALVSLAVLLLCAMVVLSSRAPWLAVTHSSAALRRCGHLLGGAFEWCEPVQVRMDRSEIVVTGKGRNRLPRHSRSQGMAVRVDACSQGTNELFLRPSRYDQREVGPRRRAAATRSAARKVLSMTQAAAQNGDQVFAVVGRRTLGWCDERLGDRHLGAGMKDT